MAQFLIRTGDLGLSDDDRLEIFLAAQADYNDTEMPTLHSSAHHGIRTLCLGMNSKETSRMGPTFPYYSHTARDSYGNDMGVGIGMGVPLLGGKLLEQFLFGQALGYLQSV